MTNETKHSLIREMERNGCDIALHASTKSNECTITVYWRGWQTTIVRADVFDFERAYAEWTEYRDSVAYRVMSHQDVPRAAVIAPKVAKQIQNRTGMPTPNVAKEVSPVKKAVERPRTRRNARTAAVSPPSGPTAHTGEKSSPQSVLSDRLPLKERLKLRNQERVA